jgi:aspartate aminotransferase
MAGFAESPTLRVSTIARRLRAEGRDVVDFGSGEPDFDTPEHIKQAAWKALHEGFTKYTTPSGIDELKDAIVDKLKRDNDLVYSREQVVVSCGAKHTLHNLAQVLLDPGDEVILPSPYWTTYETIIQMAEAVPVILPTSESEGFRVSLEVLEHHLTPRTKAIVLNSPSNPTGSMYGHDELAAMARLAVARGIYVIADDIYEKIIFDGRVHTSIIQLMPEAPHLGILVNGFSKTYAMTGWRLGYAAGPREIIAAMGNYQSQTTSNPTSFVQKAGVEALRGPQEAVGLMVQEFEQRRNYVVERLNAMEGLSCFRPMGAFYAFPNVSATYGKRSASGQITDSISFAEHLLQTAGVAVVPGAVFGDDRCIRLSFATSMGQLHAGLDRIEQFAKGLQASPESLPSGEVTSALSQPL